MWSRSNMCVCYKFEVIYFTVNLWFSLVNSDPSQDPDSRPWPKITQAEGVWFWFAFFLSSKFINSCSFARRSEKNVRSTHRATNKLIIQTKSNNKLPRIINKQCARCGWRRLEFKRNSVQPVWKDDALLEEGELLEFDWVHGEILWTQTYIQKYIFFNF